MHSRAVIGWRFGWAVATLAVFCQIASLLLPMPSVAAAEIVAGYSIICHADGAAPGRTPASPQPADCSVCPHCLVAASPAVVAVPPLLPRSGAGWVMTVIAPAQDRHIILHNRFTIQARGPPAPV